MSTGFLPSELVELLEREAEQRGSTPEALTVQLLLRLAPEEERPRILVRAAETLLDHAGRLVEAGKYGEACRRVWSSILLALDAHAVLLGSKLPRGLRDYVRLSEEAGRENKVFMDAFYAGIAALVAWREGAGSPGHCERILWWASQLLETVKSRTHG
ncbi:hypothetical protein [Hyperthermus butylicus]|uniref:Uncharacterized protein n=1 Tax=Hyperthermus butylicus (strain DSM 5456 / JCM 9403 / PLM1-5) TaxID=415426 RepID=A2BJA8_HYPBU|nr:hypothetical protein [Hyperthermus butylicus]ABM80069.1 hypothetical protein Hbut_0197 [Hyperthermus butylicus DSM 5456]